MMADAVPITDETTEDVTGKTTHEISDDDYPFGSASDNGDKANDVNDEDSYAARAARNLRDEDDASSEELSDSHPYARRRFKQYRYLSDFEKEHFHPFNVTPDRPCTAFFRADSELTSKHLFDNFISCGIPASGVRCLQRKPTGEVFVTFSTADYCSKFLEHSRFIPRRYRSDYGDRLDHTTLTYLTIYDAPYELPDVAIEARLKPYVKKIHFKRRGRLQGYPDVLNGRRHYRVELKESVPCYLRFGKFQIRFYHDGQTKTCRKCGVSDHIAKDCDNSVCFNCDKIGHMAKECPEPMKCCICKSEKHRAIDCPLSWYRRPATHREDDLSSGEPEDDNPDANDSQPKENPEENLEENPADDAEQLSDSNTQPEDSTNIISESAPLAAAIPARNTATSEKVLNSQGLLIPPPQPIWLTQRPVTVLPSSFVSEDLDPSEAPEEADAEMSETDEEETDILESPLLMTAAAKKLKSTRKRIGRRNTAKIPTTNIPARKPTAPTMASTHKKTPPGSQSSKPSDNAPT